MIYSIEKITSLIGARRYGNAEREVAFLLTDSRSLCFPEETLFFAINTSRNDGHNYIAHLYDRGVSNFVVESLPAQWQSRFPDANFLQVLDTRKALQRLAERHRDEFDIPVVGITGSNGKTIVKEWLHQLLSPDMTVTRSPRSYNSQIGVPLSMWLMNEHTQIGIFEAGISQTGEMEALRDIIQPTIAVLTNLGDAHQENFSSMEEKCEEKLKLFRDAKVLVYPGDSPFAGKMAEAGSAKSERLYWSTVDPSAPFFVKSVDSHPSSLISHPSSLVSYVYKGVAGSYTLPFIDEASINDSIVCAIVALHLGMSPDTFARRMRQLEPVAMRLEVKEGQYGLTLINDSYNSDIHSLDIALDFMRRRPSTLSGTRKTLILSDIKQSGMPDEELYREVSKLCKERGVEKFIGIGEAVSAQAGSIEIAEKYFYPSVVAFTRSEVFHALHDEVILIKGARQFGFDQLTEMLVKRVHETTLEVNLGAVVDNLNYYRSFLRPDTKLVCMIKADGYGAGAVEIAKTLQDHRVDYLAVAVADEGAKLRRNGITQAIIVMNPEMSAFKTIFDYDLEPEVYSFRLLDALISAAEREGITGWPVHIKLDTGMCRLGFNPHDDLERLVDRLTQQNAVIPRSVFSHFVGSDSDDFDEFSARQYQLFLKAATQLQQAFPHKILRHICNSAGIEHFPDRQLDMCRLGLGLYGINPRNNAVINNVSTLKTTILQLRHVAAGESIGYSRRTILSRDSLIAAIPIGYADGLNRHLGNRGGYCLVNGQPADYVGNICMDVAMVDVTDIPCQEGDTVEIFGEHLPVTVLSDKLGTIPYEVLTGVSNRVKRVYFQE